MHTWVPLVAGLSTLVVVLVFFAGLRLMRADALEGWDVDDIALLRDLNKRKQRASPLEQISRRYAPPLQRALGPRAVNYVRHRIDLAGRPEGITVESFFELVVRYTLILGAAALAMLSLGQPLMALVVLAGIPLFPLSRISGHQRKRRADIDQNLPDLLDVLAVTVGAGVGFRSALARVSSRFEGPLREEFAHTLHQLDVGVPRRQAFTALRDRCDSDAMTSFVSAFLQAEELGAPLASALQQIATDSRREAAQRARQRAARTVPRVTLIVSVVLVPPTLVLLIVGLFLGSDIDIGSVLNGGG
jgi:tight adherence protein C